MLDKQTFSHILQGILDELSLRIDEGIVDLQNPKHLQKLGEIFDEMELYQVGDQLIENLMREDEDDDYTHLGAGIYVSKRDVDPDGGAKDGAQKYRKDGEKENASYTAISDEEAEQIRQKQGDAGEKAAASFNQQQAKDGGQGGVEGEGEGGGSVNPTTSSGKNYTDQLPPEDPAYTGDGGKDKENQKEEKKKKKQDLLKKDHQTTDEQLNMTKTEAEQQAVSKGTKDVGAGTAESRAGEAMVHKGLRLLKEGNSIEEIEEIFKNLVNQDDHVLNSKTGKKWVNASIASLKKIDETIGIENIEDISWDTKQGREAIGVDPNLETSSDMFVRTKDGRNIGISLKKDGKVFLNNGGWAKQSEKLLEALEGQMPDDEHQRLSEAMSIDAYKKDLQERFVKTTETITPDILRDSFERLKENPNDQREFSGSSREKYFTILDNPELLIKKIKMGTANGNEQKAYAKLLQTYHKDEYDYIRKSDEGLTKRAFEVLNQSDEAKKGMNRHIIKSMHIMETLGLNKTITDGGVDGFVTLYGIEPDGAALNEETLITLLGSGFKQRLDETINEVRSGNLEPKELEDFIVDAIEIDYESGEILFRHETNKRYPLFKMSGRTRGIGSSPVMEMVQTPFMAHALKMGTFNTDDWDEKSLKRFEKDIQEES
jgi:hypothetical protein